MAEKVLFESQSLDFSYNEMFGVFVSAVFPPPFSLALGEKYQVVWDGTEYEVTAIDTSAVMPNTVGAGNGAAWGYAGNNEPFVILYTEGSDISFISLTDTAPNTHTVGVYQTVEDAVLYTVSSTSLKKVADAIREKSGSADPIAFPDGFVQKISNISGGGGGSSADVRYVTFMNGDTVLYKKPVAVGDDCVDVLSKGLISTPTKESSAQYNYTYYGWGATDNGAADANILKSITEDKTVYAIFTATLRTYTVRFYNGGTLLQEVPNVPYGGSATYTGDAPVKEEGDYMFVGWSPSPTNITADTDCYAKFTAWGASADFDSGYGVEWDYSKNSPILTRIGLSKEFSNPSVSYSISGVGSSPFDNIMPWAGMKRYNIIDGEVAYSEDDAEFSMTDYDTVVYIPPFYYTAYKSEEASRWRWAISPTEKEGYVLHPGSGRYIGRYHTSGDSTAVFSKSGVQPLVSTKRADFRTYSHNKGDNWWMLDVATWSAIQLLFLVEYASFNSQGKLGVGKGATTSVLGQTDAAAYHTYYGASYNQYRWIEHPWGRCYDVVDGAVIQNYGVYLGTDNSTFTDNKSSFAPAGVTLPSSLGYITGYGYSKSFPWAFLPNMANGGSESTYVCDYVSMNNGGPYMLIVGGDTDGTGSRGLFSFASQWGVTDYRSTFGSRLIYIP